MSCRFCERRGRDLTTDLREFSIWILQRKAQIVISSWLPIARLRHRNWLLCCPDCWGEAKIFGCLWLLSLACFWRPALPSGPLLALDRVCIGLTVQSKTCCLTKRDTVETAKTLANQQQQPMCVLAISPESSFWFQVLPSCYGGDADLLPIEVAVKRFNRSLSSKGSQHKDKLSQKEARSRLGDFMRLVIAYIWQPTIMLNSFSSALKHLWSTASHTHIYTAFCKPRDSDLHLQCQLECISYSEL